MPRVVTSVTLGDRVYRLRKERYWSQDNLAQRMQTEGYPTWHHTQVGMIENGTRHLRLYEGFSMAAILGVSLYELAFGMEGDDIQLMLATQVRRLVAEREELLERLSEVDKLLMGYGKVS